MFQIPDSLIKKYSVAGPRYTSYPTAPMWHEISTDTQKEWYSQAMGSTRPLSLYLHIPFCKARCSYCGCNVLITRQQERSGVYVDYLLKELETLKPFIASEKKIAQLHFGGGTPNFLLDHEFEQIFEKIHSLFSFEENAEVAIELDPKTLRPHQLELMKRLGFNRLSMGVQDFDPTVQEAVRRIQPKELTAEILTEARDLGFKGINFDLIYGLPFQTRETIQSTLESVIEMKPDRLAIYNFAYLPERMPHQKKLDASAMPDEKAKLDFLFMAIKQLGAAGYQYIGMDHFALAEDELSIAQQERTLYRNFMGYTPKSGMDLYGIGASSIGETDGWYIQNERKVKGYQQYIETSELAGTRGILLSQDDKIRKWTILRLMCNFYLSFPAFQETFDLDFRQYFKEELRHLEEMQQDGLLQVNEDHILILDPGKILVRNICMVFDAWLNRNDSPKVKYSKTI